MSKNPFSNNDIPVVNDEWESPCQVNVLDKDTDTRLAIQDNTATEAMVAELRAKVNKRNKGISVLVDENKGESAKILSDNFANIATKMMSEDVIDRVIENAKTPKDFADIAKAFETINNLAHKQLTQTADIEEAKKGNKDLKIGLAFGDGKIALAIDTNGDDNG